MAFWTLFGLRAGQASTRWPTPGQSDGQAGVLGLPRADPSACEPDCRACAEVCPTGAIRATPGLEVDYGRCIGCQLCVEACPSGAMSASSDWAFGATQREDLVLAEAPPPAPSVAGRGAFRRSLHIRHVDAGSCNGCESELQALNSPFYNLHRLGIFFTASPRFADLLLVTGPVTEGMHAPLLAAWEAMAEPRWVMAVGTCAVSGGVCGGSGCRHGLEGVLPVDLYLPGCPPNPAAIMHGLLVFLGRARQRVAGGRLGE